MILVQFPTTGAESAMRQYIAIIEMRILVCGSCLITSSPVNCGTREGGISRVLGKLNLIASFIQLVQLDPVQRVRAVASTDCQPGYRQQD